MKIFELAAKANQIRREEGWMGLQASLRELRRRRKEQKKYAKWIEKHKITASIRQEITEQLEALHNKLKISVILPVYNTEEKWLRLCIESVIRQLYPNWELCVADDCSTMPHVRRVLEEYSEKECRIKLIFRTENGHISAASNSALNLATGEFAVLLDHDDELSEDALFWVAREINNNPGVALIYSDEDVIDQYGRRSDPKFKPNFSQDLFYSLNLTTHLSAYRTDLIKKLEGFLIGCEGSQDYDLALRVIEQINEDQIRHIPKILYHWRAIPGSVAFSMDEKPYAHERAREALRAHFERAGIETTVSSSLHNLHRVRYRLPDNLPKATIFIIYHGSKRNGFSKQSLSENTKYENLEIIEIDGGAAAINSAVNQSKSDVLCFIGAGLIPQSDDWLEEMASFSTQAMIGAIGGKLLNKDGTVAGTALVFGAADINSVAHKGLPSTAGGNILRNVFVGNYSAVSIRCMTVRRELFELVGGLDEQHLPNHLYDSDFCLKLRALGYRNVFTPHAIFRLKNGEKNLREEIPYEEKSFFLKKWRSVVEHDPFYNPNLSKKDGSFSIDI